MKTIIKLFALIAIAIVPNILNAFEMPEKKSPDEKGFYYTRTEVQSLISEARKTESTKLYSVVLNEKKQTVAHVIAIMNNIWTTDNQQVLMLKDVNNTSVAHILAETNMTWVTNNQAILKMQESVSGMSVAHFLAFRGKKWQTNKTEILSIKNKKGYSVAHYLARFHPSWTTKNKMILELTGGPSSIAVEDVLKQNNKL